MKYLGLVLIRLYQAIFPGGQCRFEKSCSQYTYEAICNYGMIKGTWLGIKRISRCHPWSKIN